MCELLRESQRGATPPGLSVPGYPTSTSAMSSSIAIAVAGMACVLKFRTGLPYGCVAKYVTVLEDATPLARPYSVPVAHLPADGWAGLVDVRVSKR